jgi:hypothetical protein
MSHLPIASHIIIPQSIAWHAFTKGMNGSLLAPIAISGDKALAEHMSG